MADGLIYYKIIPNTSKIEELKEFFNLILDQFEETAPQQRSIVIDNATVHKLSLESKIKCEKLQFSFSFDHPYAYIFNLAENSS